MFPPNNTVFHPSSHHQSQFLSNPNSVLSTQDGRDIETYSIISSPVSSNDSKASPASSSGSFFCRICHEGDSQEALVAPCKCTGTVALIHISCLEHWLTSSNSDKCEICKYAYKILKEPRSCSEYLQDPVNQFNVRNMIADVICFCLLTPLLVVSTYLCFLGAKQYFMRERWEAVGLLILSLFLLGVYFTWCHVTTRFHVSMWKSWQRSNQQIRLREVHEAHCRPSECRSLQVSAINQTFPDSTDPREHHQSPVIGNPLHFIELNDDSFEVSDTSRILIV